MSSDFARLMEPVALKLLGEPQDRHHGGQEWRYGSRGSLSVRIDNGTFYDNEAGIGGGTLKLIEHRGGMDKAGALAWMRDNKLIEDQPQQATKPRIVATYDYTDAAGELLFQVCRYEPKDFRQRRPDGKNGWVWKMAGVQKVIYRLPKMLEAITAGRTIYITEGEKAADRLAALGLDATCSPGGAGKWRSSYSAFLRGADVVILPDNDQPGHQHAEQVASVLQGIAKRVRVLALPGLPDKGDVADWIDGGGTAVKLETIAREAADAFTSSEQASRQDNGADHDPVISARTAYHDLRGKLDKTEDGGVRATHSNLLLILKYDPLLRGLFRLDAFSGRHLISRPVPVLDKDLPPAPGPYPRQWDAGDVTRVLAYVQKEWAHGFKKGAVEECLMVEGQDRQFHPVRDWLTSLRWDGKPRIDRWLTMTFGAELDDYHRAVSSKLLIAAVRRVRQPGCKFDHLVVLEGAQGIGKSRALALLFGQDWTTDDVPADLGSKDAAIALAGVWCVELSEIEPLIRSEAETVKAFLSRGTDRFRPPYGRQTIEVPRQCVLVGTTNSTDYLRDTTGNRRIWPVQCRSVASADIQWLVENRDQLWAEAAHLEATGVAIWLDNLHVRETAVAAQAARLAEDPWGDKVRDFIAGKAEVKVPDILQTALFIDTPHQDKRAQMRVTAILQVEGWRRVVVWDGDIQKTVRKWLPPDECGA